MAPPTGASPERRDPRRTGAPDPSRQRRPPLRVVEPARRARRRPLRRVAGSRVLVALAATLVVGSLLSVVVADAVVDQGQVRLSGIDAQITAAQAEHGRLELSIAEQSAPTRVVAEATQLGMAPAGTISELPQVSLEVPLPVPATGNAGATSPPAVIDSPQR